MMLLSLVDLCLNSVAEHLKKHCLLFTTSDDYYTKRKLEFLQKRYSPDLISHLCAEEDALTEEFIDILVNKHTKFLDTSWFRKCPLAKLTSKLAEIGCNLEKIVCDHEFVNGEFRRAIRDSICHCNNLKSFTFQFKCGDWILRNVAKFCRHIEEIDVEDSAITSEGARYLCRDEDGKLLCKTLKKLYFGDNWLITDNDVEYLLKNLPSLEVIGYPNLPLVLYSLHKENLPSLGKVVPYNITTLDLTICSDTSIDIYFTNIVKVCASVCPRLKNFSCIVDKQEELSYLFNLPDLEKFHIKSYVINITSFLMSKGSQLTSLNIELCTVSVSVLAENCPCLEELILDRANILCDEDSKPVFNSLSSLTFIGEEIHFEGIKLMLSLSSFIKLESLSVKNNFTPLISSELKGAILKCCELCPIKKIAFQACLFGKEFIENLLCICRTLDHLTLDACVNKEREDLLCFAELLPNKPKISVRNHLSKFLSGMPSNFYQFPPPGLSRFW